MIQAFSQDGRRKTGALGTLFQDLFAKGKIGFEPTARQCVDGGQDTGRGAREQEAVDRNAISAETREREQEAKRRQEQIDLTERQRQEEAEQKQRLSQQQLDQKLKKIQAERAKLARQAELSEVENQIR
jgi:hypothetical protein